MRWKTRTHSRYGILTTYFIIFGAAVRPGGTPSGTLRRRVEGALALARKTSDRRFVVTGGVGDNPPAEAEVMRDLLCDGGVAPGEIVLDCLATDTLSSVVNCAEIIPGDAAHVVVCSSAYHNPRCTLLFRLLGIRATWDRMPPDRPHLGFLKWLYFVVREIPATVWDTLVLLVRRP